MAAHVKQGMGGFCFLFFSRVAVVQNKIDG